MFQLNILRHISYEIVTFQNLNDFEEYWNSRPEVFYKKGVIKSFTKFTGKHLGQSLFFSKVAGLRLVAASDNTGTNHVSRSSD